MSSPKTLLKAVTAGRSRQVRLLLDLGASTEEYDDCGQTPLIRAVFLEQDRNRDKIIKMLLKKGAVVSKADVIGRNALIWASLYGRDDDVSLMLEYADVDLDLNKADINGQTALFHAVSSGNAATVKLVVQALVKYDLSADIPDYNSVTPLINATRLGHDICASILIHNGNAKVGLGQANQEKFARKEKWAISSLRERSRQKKANKQQQSQFPPIPNNLASSKVTLNTERNRRRIGLVHCELDQDNGFSSDEDTPNNSTSVFLQNNEQTSVSNSQIDIPVQNCLQQVPVCRIPASILASPTNSTLFYGSSGDESEVDSVASTVVEGKQTIRQIRKPKVDLTSMFDQKQDQMCTSYRQAAVKIIEKEPSPPQVETQDEEQVKNTGRKNCEASKWRNLKKSLRLVGLSKNNQSKRDTLQDNSDHVVQKAGALPNIEKKVHNLPSLSLNQLQKPESEKNRNYSEI